jgi:hypothetical protein
MTRFVGGEGVLGVFFVVATRLKLGQVPVIIALHLKIEDLGGGRRDEMGVKQAKNAVVDGGKLELDLGT